MNRYVVALAFVLVVPPATASTQNEELAHSICDHWLDKWSHDQQAFDACYSEHLEQFNREEDHLAEQRKRADAIRAETRAAMEAETREREAKEAALAAKPGVRIGATAKWVRESSSWGEPDSINVTVTKYGRDEQWVYGVGQYLYFHNGRLTGIQH